MRPRHHMNAATASSTPPTDTPKDRSGLAGPLWLIVQLSARRASTSARTFGGHRRRDTPVAFRRQVQAVEGQRGVMEIERPPEVGEPNARITGNLARDRRLQRGLLLHMTIGDIRLARHQHRRAGRTRRANRIDHGAAVVPPVVAAARGRRIRRVRERAERLASDAAAVPAAAASPGRNTPFARHRDHDSPGRCRRDIAIRVLLATSGSTGR